MDNQIITAQHIIDGWKEKTIDNVKTWELLTGQTDISSDTARKYINAVERFINNVGNTKVADKQRVALELEEFTNSQGVTVYIQKSTMMLDIQNMNDKTPNDLMRLHGYDPLKWKLKSAQNKAYQGTSKKQGTYTMYSSTLRVEPLQSNISENDMKEVFDKFKAPKHKVKNPVKVNKKDIMLEIPQTDFHLGLLAWKEESGENYNIKIAVEQAEKSLMDIISRVDTVEQIVYPCGSDFFNADDEKGMTNRGTPQTMDNRWQKIFRKGCEYNVWAIDNLLKKTNDVQVMYINSNHDAKMSYLLILWLDAYYRNDKRVTVNISPYPRQYIKWGDCGICYLHTLPKKRIDKIFQVEAPKLWGETKYREIHIGHLHHEELIEHMGVKVRMISPMTASSDWSTRQGYIGSIRQIQAFMWHKKLGLRAVLNSVLEEVE